MAAPRKGTAETAEEPTGVVDIILSEPGARERFSASAAGLPEAYQDESWLDALANAQSLSDIAPEFLAALTEVYGSSLIAKEDLVGAPFVILGYDKVVGKFKHPISREHMRYYTFRILTERGRGSVVLSGTGMAPVFDVLESQGKRPPFLVKGGLRRSDDWTNDEGEPMNGTWYLG